MRENLQGAVDFANMPNSLSPIGERARVRGQSDRATQYVHSPLTTVSQAIIVGLSSHDCIPKDQYTKSGDLHIAYQVTGAGPLDRRGNPPCTVVVALEALGTSRLTARQPQLSTVSGGPQLSRLAPSAMIERHPCAGCRRMDAGVGRTHESECAQGSRKSGRSDRLDPRRRADPTRH